MSLLLIECRDGRSPVCAGPWSWTPAGSRHAQGWERDPRRERDGPAESGTGDAELPLGRVLTWDANSWRHLVFVGLTVAAVAWLGPWGLLAYPLLHLLSDALYYGAGYRVKPWLLVRKALTS